jgi:hypothetical protein
MHFGYVLVRRNPARLHASGSVFCRTLPVADTAAGPGPRATARARRHRPGVAEKMASHDFDLGFTGIASCSREPMISIGRTRASVIAAGECGPGPSPNSPPRAGLSLPTVKRLEGGFGPRVSEDAQAKLQRAIEAAGIEFLRENGGGLGVRFRKPRKRK